MPGGSWQCHRCGGNRFSPQHCAVVGSHHPESSRTISARFTRGRVCGPPPFNYRIALEEETPRCNDPHSRYASLVTNLSPSPCFTPTDRQFCHELPIEQARYFSKNTREVLAINMGKFWQSANHRYSDRAHRTIGPLQAIGLGGSLNAERNRFP